MERDEIDQAFAGGQKLYCQGGPFGLCCERLKTLSANSSASARGLRRLGVWLVLLAFCMFAGELGSWRFGISLADPPPRRIADLIARAGKGDLEAQFQLGEAYFAGQEVPQNFSKALEYYADAADHGHLGSQLVLSHLYFKGVGVMRDFQQATKWGRKAAEQGDPSAQYIFASMVTSMEAGIPNFIEAYKWLNLAAMKNHANAVKFRAKLSGLMSLAEIQKAQGLSAEFLEQRGQTNAPVVASSKSR